MKPILILLLWWPVWLLGDDISRWGSLRELFPEAPQYALAKAVNRNNPKAIQRAIEAGADVNRPGKHGLSFLVLALLRDNKDSFAYLLERGANPNIPNDGMFEAAIFEAAASEDPWWLARVMEHGGNVNAVHMPGGNISEGGTPLFKLVCVESAATRASHLKTLLGAGANINHQNNRGATALIKAVEWDSNYVFAYELLQAGADPMLRDKYGWTLVYPMTESTQPAPNSVKGKWREKVVALLKEKGIDVPPAKRTH
jgi:ankyrin repeat protein